ncbi:MAG: MAPEG family protein [Pseudomonadota bacterium]|nr:MAPEG family protein [Pseudomonadota bacterium]
MQAWLMPYEPTVIALGVSALLLCVQLLVLDVAGIVAKHAPGLPIKPDHASFLFRASRAHANTNESIAAFIVLAIVGVLVAANASWLNTLAWVYVAARSAHMVAYYLGVQLARSAAFAVGLLALIGMCAVMVVAFF